MQKSPCKTKTDKSWIRRNKNNDSEEGVTATIMSTPVKSSTPHKTFKTPGFTIPTPAYKSKLRGHNLDSDTSKSKSPGNANMIDDAAFLPDDFHVSSSEKENTFTKSQVKDQIAAAIATAQQEWIAQEKEKLQAQVFDEMRQEAEGQLGAHERMWQEEHEEDLEKCKTDFKQQQQMQTEHHDAQMEAQRNTHGAAFSQLQSKYEALEETSASEAKQLREQLEALASLVQEKETSIATLREELISQHESDIFKLESEWQDRFAQQVEAAKTELTEQLRKEAAEEKVVLEQQHEADIVKLQSEWQDGTAQQVEAAKSELVLQIEQLRKEAAEEKVALDQRVEEATKEYESQIETSKKQWDVERTEMTNREEEARLKVEDLSGQVQTLVDNATKVESEMDDLKSQLLKSHELLDTERTTNKTTNEDKWTKHKNELLRLKEELKEKLEAERKAMETELNDARANHYNQSEREKELLEKLSKLEISSRKNKDSFDLQVADVRKEHTVQIDDMLAQLDLIEAEHKERHDTLENAVDQKDAIISALGKQLAETTHRKSELESEHEANIVKLKTTREELHISLKGTAELEAAVDRLQIEKKDAVDAERRKGQTICDKVRNTTIAEAEAQFKTANEHYMTLKHEYDGALGRIGKLEKELKAVRREVESAKSDGVSREARVAAELAQSRAALATAEAAAARKISHLQSKMEVAEAMHRESKTKLDESNAARHAANMSLTSLVSEKEKLMKENKDLNAVCEELMAIVEGGGENLAAD